MAAEVTPATAGASRSQRPAQGEEAEESGGRHKGREQRREVDGGSLSPSPPAAQGEEAVHGQRIGPGGYLLGWMDDTLE